MMFSILPSARSATSGFRIYKLKRLGSERVVVTSKSKSVVSSSYGISLLKFFQFGSSYNRFSSEILKPDVALRAEGRIENIIIIQENHHWLKLRTRNNQKDKIVQKV